MDVCASAGGPVITGNVDDADRASSFRRLAQSRLGKVFLREILHCHSAILLNNAIREILCCRGLLARYRIHGEINRARNDAQMKTDCRPIKNLDKGLG